MGDKEDLNNVKKDIVDTRYTIERKKNYIYIILLVIFLIGFIIFGSFAVFQLYSGFIAGKKMNELQDQTIKEFENTTIEKTIEDSIENINEEVEKSYNYEIPDISFDWEEIKQINKDIYAWVYIPDTGINFPILQHPTIESYYLDRGHDEKKSTAGSIYTDCVNNKDFSDRQTVVYGHNMLNGTMFGELHKFEDNKFFIENQFFYVYTEEKNYVYRIFAAYEFSSAHLIYNFDLTTDTSYENYLEQIYTNESINSNFDMDIKVGIDDKLVTLSTCVSGHKNKRYLVQGVLINE